MTGSSKIGEAIFPSQWKDAAQETNKREMAETRTRVKVDTRATFKGGVIKTVKLLLINLTGSFFDDLSGWNAICSRGWKKAFIRIVL